MAIILILLCSPVLAKEADYQKANCKGKIEFVLPDKTRIDCLTDEYAIEYDFGHKWAEAIGQSLHYARLTRKKAGIVLIVKDMKYYHRLMDNIRFYNLPIEVWIVEETKK